MKHIVIIGGGQAGFSSGNKLRALGFDGKITIVCGEDELPYQRPPLSKKYLLGTFERERLYLRQDSFYHENDISLLMGEWCQQIDLNKKRIKLEENELSYDSLIITTGSIPKRLPPQIGGNLNGVHTIRNLADIDNITTELDNYKSTVVIGGGYIGLEAAASLRSKGLEVTVVEMAPRILQRVAATETSQHLRDLHIRNGTKILENTALETLIGDGNGQVTGAKLTDGRTLDADMAIIGIGIEPASDLAGQAGLKLNNGIETDINCRTSDENVFAAGDCASLPWKGSRIRLESVQNAIDQAECAASNAIGIAENYTPTPWFWSEQYDTKLQIAGLGTGYDSIIQRANEGKTAVSHWYFKDGELLAVDAVNDARSYMVGKRLLETGRQVDTSIIENPKTDLKSLMK